METIFTVDEAAKTLKVDAQTIRRMLQQGRLEGRKLGKSWRIPESAMRRVVALEDRAMTVSQQAEIIWGDMKSGNAKRHNAALRALFAASSEVQANIWQRSSEAAALHYASSTGSAELADWRALDGEPFHDDLGDYYTEQEESVFLAEQDVKQKRERKAVTE